MGRELIEYRCCSIIEGLIKETKGLRKVYPDTNQSDRVKKNMNRAKFIRVKTKFG